MQKAKFHFREAIKLSDRFDSNLRKQIFVNYGNCLDTLGRGVEALYSYDSSLKMDSDFSMAIGNKAQTLRFFADITGQYRGAIYLESYQAIKSILNKEDLVEIGGVAVKQAFERELKSIEDHLKDKKVLAENIQRSKLSPAKLSRFEKFYIDFCIEEKLFLNFHLHQDHSEAAIADPIFISLITDVKDNDTFYRLAKYISLYALYDIYQDFKLGECKRIRDIRNALTHQKLSVYDSMITDWDKKDDKHNIGYDTILDKTTELLRLSKSAIIYMVNFVNLDENKKRGNRLIAPMYVDTSQFL